MKAAIIATLATLAIVSYVVQPGQAAIVCGQVDAALIPCVPYLIGRANAPTTACCTAVKNVKGMAKTTPDRRALCTCLKAAANNNRDLKDANAQSLPSKCSVTMDVPISRTVQCDKIA